jgi:transcription initiation factor TFIID subunit 12
MDAMGNPQASAQQQQQQQLASMIRPEQVKRLPHLNDDKKQQHEAFIQRLWDTLRSNPPGSSEYQKAYSSLSQVSTSLMTGMKRFTAQQQQRQQQQQQQQQQQHQQQQQQQNLISQQPGPSNEVDGNRPAGLGIQANQILPHIQQKVSAYPFALPPTVADGSAAAEHWLREARNRLAQAMQRAEQAQKKKTEIQRTAQARAQSGNPLTPQEQEGLHTKVMQCNKFLTESNSFMEKFKEQQNQFRMAAQQQRYEAQAQANTAQSENTKQAEPSMQAAQPTPQGGPQAHSISSAVSAARDRATNAAANQQDSVTPTNTQPQSSQTPGQQQPQQPHQTPQSAMSLPQQDGGGLPFSTHSALPQPAQNHGQSHPQSATHAHPSQNANFMNPTKKEERLNIPKNLNVATPRPVPMPPARPTLNGGPGVGMPGQMGEPAIPTMPGYVLESSEDGRVLSKKKLDELAREVCGPGEENRLTPEAEEVGPHLHPPLHLHPVPAATITLTIVQILLNVADDFVDNLISTACKLAKLRGAASLEQRDIQLVLERHYNIRVPGFSSDEIRTVRRQGGTVAWQQKMTAVQAAKLTGGGNEVNSAGGKAGDK